MTTFTLLDKAECGKRISALRVAGAGYQTEVHICAVSALAHIRDCGDWTLFTDLLGALPTGVRANALAGPWVSRFSGKAVSFTYDKSKGAWVGKMAKAWKPEMFDIEGACKTTFGDFVPEKGYDTMGIIAVISMLKRKANEAGNHPDGRPKVDPKARELFARLHLRAVEIVSGVSEPLVVVAPKA